MCCSPEICVFGAWVLAREDWRVMPSPSTALVVRLVACSRPVCRVTLRQRGSAGEIPLTKENRPQRRSVVKRADAEQCNSMFHPVRGKQDLWRTDAAVIDALCDRWWLSGAACQSSVKPWRAVHPYRIVFASSLPCQKGIGQRQVFLTAQGRTLRASHREIKGQRSRS